MFGLIPLLGIVVQALGLFDHPSAKTAVSAIGDVVQAVQGTQIPPEQVQAADAATSAHVEKMRELDVQDDAAQAQADVSANSALNATIQAEEKSEDRYVRRMRPTWGYAMALAWLIQVLSVCAMAYAHPDLVIGYISAIGNAMSLQWGAGLSVLGIYVHGRSREKQALLAAGASPSAGTAAEAVRAVATGASGLWAGITAKVARR